MLATTVQVCTSALLGITTARARFAIRIPPHRSARPSRIPSSPSQRLQGKVETQAATGCISCGCTHIQPAAVAEPSASDLIGVSFLLHYHCISILPFADNPHPGLTLASPYPII